MNTAQKHGTDRYSLQPIISCKNLLFHLFEDMEKSSGTKVEGVDQLTTASNGDCFNNRVKSNTLKQDSQEPFSEILTKITSQLVKKYNEKEN